MKKVIGVAVAASLVAGMAFADVAVGLNARLRSNMYHVEDNKDVDSTTTIFDLDGANSHAGSGSMSDTLSFNAKTDFAGVQLEMAPVDSGSVTVDTKYNAWLAFGGLKFSFGTYDSRFVDRLNTTVGESGLLDSDDIAKYGTALLKTWKYVNRSAATYKEDASGNIVVDKVEGATKSDSTYTFLKDASNVSASEGSRKTNLTVDYTFKDLPGDLLIKAGILNCGGYSADENDATDFDETLKTQIGGYLFEADYMQKDLIKMQLMAKLPTEDQKIFGAYIQPLMLPVKAVLGFTYGTYKDALFTNEAYKPDLDKNGYMDKNTNGAGTNYTGDLTVWVIDGRLGYQVSDAINTTLVAKYEHASVDISGVDLDPDTALTVAGEVSYIVNDLATAFVDAGIYYGDLDDNDDADSGDNFFKVRPGVVLTAGKNAKITAAFQYNKCLNAGTGDLAAEYSIPVIFRVKM